MLMNPKVLGLIIGGFITEYANWHWIFFIEAIVAIPVSVACLFSLPESKVEAHYVDSDRRLDWFGITVLTGMSSDSNCSFLSPHSVPCMQFCFYFSLSA
jgi:MFS family permease